MIVVTSVSSVEAEISVIFLLMPVTNLTWSLCVVCVNECRQPQVMTSEEYDSHCGAKKQNVFAAVAGVRDSLL